MDRKNTCCFTGHREIPAEEHDLLRAKLRGTIRLLYKEGYTGFVTGGAVGFDTMAAQEVLRLKKLCPNVTLTVVSPFLGQSDNFPPKQKAAFEYIKAQSDEFIILRANYQSGCMMERNRKMVDMSSICVAFMKNQSSGTANTVRYALKNRLRVINLFVPDDEIEIRRQSHLSRFFEKKLGKKL